ncbi:MAG: DUF3810 domain-containing protein [Clostridiales bacterium]|nr:DUF3810 domain-containing protein [Clostridiales bacterium]
MKIKTGKNRIYFAVGLLLLITAILLEAAARHFAGYADWYARKPYRVLVGSIGRLFGLFPFSVVELFLYVLIIGCVVCLIVRWREPVWIFCRVVCVLGILAILYTCNCGINYYAEAFSSYAGFGTGPHSEEKLETLCEYLVEMVNESVGVDAAGSVYAAGARDAGGDKEESASVTVSEIADESEEIVVEETSEVGRMDMIYRAGNQAAWKQESVLAMKKLGEQYEVLGGFYPEPKELRISWILSVQQLCGVYSPFTIEANFNGDMPDYNIPHTMCHELSHLKGFMREDEANFIGYLACVGSDNKAFRYSGYLTGWVYAGNQLAAVNWERYAELSALLCEQAQQDLRENNAFWDQYEGKVAEVSNQVNDTYLKANGREDGVKSYGRMVDLMLAYYGDLSDSP